MNTFFDSNQVRYTLFKTNGGQPFNWIFVPGGPGMDSSYLNHLLEDLDLPGNSWLIDMPGNGSNSVDRDTSNYDDWIPLLPTIVQKFENPIYLGHSFGGMIAMLNPSLEQHLKGCILLNSSPCFWEEASAKRIKELGIPDISEARSQYIETPTDENLRALVEIALPTYVADHAIDKARELLKTNIFADGPPVWFRQKAMTMPYKATWVPEALQTLIISGDRDGILPHTLFEADKRFDRLNIDHCVIKNSGHFSSLDQPEKVKALIYEYINKINLT